MANTPSHTALRIDVTFSDPSNLDRMDDINDAIRKIADLANLSYETVAIVNNEYGEKVASLVVNDAKDVG
jgi:RecA/RadA recombinase